MTANQNRTLAALSSALLLLLVLHAENNDSFTQPSTYLGIVVGLVVATVAYLVGKRIQKNRAN